MNRFYNFQTYNYSNPIPKYVEYNVESPPYIVINKETIYINSDQFLSTLEFKVNKRGGDLSKISFSAKYRSMEIGNKVQLYVNNKLKYTGFIEKDEIINNNYQLTIIPEWSKFNQIIVSGGIVIENTISIYDLVLSLAVYITSLGIGFSNKRINIPNNIMITTTTMGRTIAEILDDCEKKLPQGYCWGVIDSVFYFKQINEETITQLNWRLGDFEDSTISEDFSDIYTQTSVFVQETDGEGNSQNRSIGIVGASPEYPEIPFFNKIGIKMNKYEFPFEIEQKTALDFAYNLLQNQFLPIQCKIKNLNFLQKLPDILQSIKIYSKPQTYINETFSKSQDVIVNDLYNSIGGFIQQTNESVNSSLNNDDIFIFDLSRNNKYLTYCNCSDNIISLYITYFSKENQVLFNITDDNNEYQVFGSFGKVSINLEAINLDKRKLKIICLTQTNSFNFNKVSVTFSNCQKLVVGNIRSISYKMNSSFQFSIDLEIANIGTVINGYLYKLNENIKRISEILSTKS